MTDGDDRVERGSWGDDAEDGVQPAATAGVDAGTDDPAIRSPEGGIESTVAPWETGRGEGGPLRATGEVLGTILLAGLVALALVVVGTVGLFLTVGTEPGLVSLLLVSLVGSQAGFALTAYGYLRWRGESIRSLGIAVPGFKSVVLVVVGVVATMLLAITVGSIVQAIGLPSAENSTAATAREVPSSFLLLIPISIFIIGPCEELLFRGVVQRRLREVASAPVAIVAASALFAAVHVVALQGGLTARLTSIAILFFPTLVFGVLYEYTKNVVVTSLVHGLYDAVLFSLLYVALTFAPESTEGAQGVVAFVAAVV